jgi:hypothetical protein
MRRWSSVGLVVVIVLLAGARPAQAYIDPGNTSMLVQLVVGGIAALAVLSRRLWQGTVMRLSAIVRAIVPSSSGSVRRQLDR